ncbi:MAG: hypothetical protein Q8M24_00070 [Pseudolabrys sp.]|nr:hypothetical protein [Pseudolabrys sp.]MDP2293843.1 hypothetical protein [Pseudolabrys sp.]
MKLNCADLEKAGKLKPGALGESGVEELRELLLIYKERSTVQEARSFWGPDDIRPINKQQPAALLALVGAVWEVWRERGGQGHGGRWDEHQHVHGAFIQLLQALFEQSKMQAQSPRTFRRALKAAHDEDKKLRADTRQVTDLDNFVFVQRTKT